MIVFAVLEVLGIRKPPGIVMNGTVASSVEMENLVYTYNLLRARNREQAERQAVQNREDADIDSHSQGDGQYRGYRESWAAPQSTRAETKVLKQLLEPHNAPHFMRLLFHMRDIAEFAQRRIMRVLRRHSPLNVVLHFPFEMIANILIELLKHALTSRHGSSCPAGRRICAIAPASFSHLQVSTESCLLPLTVS